MGWLENLGLHRKELRAWALYDWANSAFATTIMAGFLPTYYFMVAAEPLAQNVRTAYWGYTTAIALAVSAIAAPVLGATADYLRAKKRFLAAFMLLGVFATIMLFLVKTGDWFYASVMFILANIGFAAANIFYDSLLPHVADEAEVDRVSTAGYAIGYLGGGVLLLINLAWYTFPDLFGFPDQSTAIRASFVSVGIWWFVFSIPLLRRVNEPTDEEDIPLASIFTVGFKRVWKTFQEIRQYKQVMIFLVAFWFYSDGIGTIIKMATIFGAEIGIGIPHLIGALALVQFLGVPATFAFGPIARRLGPKGGIFLCLCIYTCICILGYFMQEAWHFWALAALVATAQGGCQALSRSLYAVMIPRRKSAEFFSFISISSRFAGIMGPVLFGIVAQQTGGSRLSILFLIAFFIIGAILLPFVNVEEGRQVARDADRRAV